MEKIKFRAWDTHYNKFKDITVNVPLSLLNSEFVTERYILQQYTGLKDKNNKEVYVGDTIPYHFDEDIQGTVKFGKSNYFFDDEHGYHVGFYFDFNNDKNRKDLGYWLNVSSVDGNIIAMGK